MFGSGKHMFYKMHLTTLTYRINHGQAVSNTNPNAAFHQSHATPCPLSLSLCPLSHQHGILIYYFAYLHFDFIRCCLHFLNTIYTTQILAVNGASLLNLPYEQSLKLLQNTGKTVELTVSQIFHKYQQKLQQKLPLTSTINSNTNTTTTADTDNSIGRNSFGANSKSSGKYCSVVGERLANNSNNNVDHYSAASSSANSYIDNDNKLQRAVYNDDGNNNQHRRQYHQHRQTPSSSTSLSNGCDQYANTRDTLQINTVACRTAVVNGNSDFMNAMQYDAIMEHSAADTGRTMTATSMQYGSSHANGMPATDLRPSCNSFLAMAKSMPDLPKVNSNNV